MAMPTFQRRYNLCGLKLFRKLPLVSLHSNAYPPSIFQDARTRELVLPQTQMCIDTHQLGMDTGTDSGPLTDVITF